MTSWAHLNVPHGGEGTQTLVIAVEVDQTVLDDPSRHGELLDRLVDEARTALADAAVRPAAMPEVVDLHTCLVCGRHTASLGALDRHLSYRGHREDHDLLAAEGDSPSAELRPLRAVAVS